MSLERRKCLTRGLGLNSFSVLLPKDREHQLPKVESYGLSLADTVPLSLNLIISHSRFVKINKVKTTKKCFKE